MKSKTKMIFITPKHVAQVLKNNSDAPKSGERDLHIAILTLAVQDIQGAKRCYIDSALAFLSGSYFETVCSRAGYDPDYVRGLISKIGQTVVVDVSLLRKNAA